MKIRPLMALGQALVVALAFAVVVPSATGFAQPVPEDQMQQMWDEAFRQMQAGEYDAAAAKFIRLAESVPASEFKANCYYNAACAFSLKGDKQKGNVNFAQAVRAGFRNLEHIAQDTDLNSIRETPMFKHVVGLIQARNFAELDALNVAELERKFYAAGHQPGPETGHLTPEQKEKLEALRRELYDRIEKEVAAMRERLRKQVDESLAELGATAGGTQTPGPGPNAEPASLGLDAKELTPSLREFMGIPAGQGLIVMSLQEGGPAAKAGIEKLDVLLSIAGKSVGSLDELASILASLRAGQTVAVVVMRSGSPKTLQVTLGAGAGSNNGNNGNNGNDTPAPSNKTPYAEGGYLGISLRAADNGMHVGSVVPDSPAAQAGIQEGDIIVKLNGKATGTMETLRAALNETFVGDTVEVIVLRNGEEKSLSLTIGQRNR